MKEYNSDQLLELFAEKCRDRSLKVTPQRSMIYRALVNASNHPTAEQVLQGVRKTFPHISFDTVNRTMMTFVQIGLIDPVEGYGRSRRFDPDVESHHHVHCVECGKIFDFKKPDYDELEVPEDIQRAFTILSKKVVINAVCQSCRGKDHGDLQE